MIRKNNLRLRAVEPSDVDLLYEWENQMELWVVSNTLTPFSRHQLEKYIKHAALDLFQTRQLRLMIDLDSDQSGQQTIGMIDLFDFDPFHLRGGVGILIHSDYRQQGHASLALNMFVNYCFNQLGLHQLYCTILDTNKTSQHLFEQQGFRLIGVKKEWRRTPAGFQDEYFYQKIAPSPTAF
jgi:diamine N-acetyltransferase